MGHLFSSLWYRFRENPMEVKYHMEELSELECRGSGCKVLWHVNAINTWIAMGRVRSSLISPACCYF